MGTAPVFASAGEALEVAYAALGYLAAADATGMAAEEQAGCLQGLERVTSVATAARSSVLGAFTAGKGYSADADHSPRAWLIHKTGITRHAAVSYTAWAKRAAAHPQVFAVLAAGDVSESFARTVCVWTGRLPLESRDKADAILMAAACSGLGLRDLAVLAGEMLARCWQPDRPDPGPGPGLDGRPDGNGEPGGEPAGQCGGDPPGGEPGRDDAGGDRPGGAGPPDGGRDEVFEDRALRLLVTFQGTGGTADDGSADAGPATVPPGFTRPCAVRSREALEQAIVGLHPQRGPAPRPALPVGRRLRPARRGVRRAPHHAQGRRRQDQPQGLRAPVPVPPPDRHPPLGLDPGRQPRRHHHRLEQGQDPDPAQPQPARPGRVTARSRMTRGDRRR
jgi:hypothetical protein